ncbi:MAG: hypothetical protein IPN69_16395 [Acidobacteria bacterium]|nr:hypothetical protein [Acidobacteriota bacterium]MBK8812291.1 hypothetical protein [Acidobacteriota bacterium]
MRFLTNLAQPLALSLYGIGDDWRDSRSRPGNFEIAFDNVNDFRTDYEPSGTFDISKRSNFELHVEVISKIAKRLDPDHMFTTTGDTDVGPLVAHQVYHRRIKDFASDLVVSAHLHNTGEFDYSQQADHRHRDHPWRESWENYGYLRREKGRKYLEKFIHRVDEISETILKSPSMVDIGESAILSTVLDQKDVYVELVGNGVLLSVSNSPTKYLDATYFALYDRILGNNSSG